MKNKIIKSLIILIVFSFSICYFFGNNMFQSGLTLKRNLTEAQIIKFEEDVKNGVEIDLNDYVVKEKTYNNKVTDINKKISHFISSISKKVFEYVFKSIDI